jgi:hypothetical protein
VIDPLLQHAALPEANPRTLRQFAGLWIIFFGGLAAWQGFGHGRQTLALVLTAVAIVVGGAGLALPRLIRPVFIAMCMVAYPIGLVVSYVLMSAFFYIVFTPVRLIFNLIGRDTLHLRRPSPSSAETYLTPKPAPQGIRSYFHQS